jgi:hypothetical protein
LLIFPVLGGDLVRMSAGALLGSRLVLIHPADQRNKTRRRPGGPHGRAPGGDRQTRQQARRNHSPP